MPNFIEIGRKTRLLQENRHARLLCIRDKEQKTQNSTNKKNYFFKIKKKMKLTNITKLSENLNAEICYSRFFLQKIDTGDSSRIRDNFGRL